MEGVKVWGVYSCMGPDLISVVKETCEHKAILEKQTDLISISEFERIRSLLS